MRVSLAPGLRRATALAVLLAPPAVARAQGGLQPVSRAAAVDSALARGTRLGVARADTALAGARLLAARAWPNPTLNAAYSKSTPQYHVTADLPLDLPYLRGARVASARLARGAARLRFAFERAATALDADTAYTRALAALERSRLSRRNARDADSLRTIAVRRRDAGDASDLDVELATVTAGQAENDASADSLAYLSAVLDLQAVMGLTAGAVVIVPSDSLGAPPLTDTIATALLVARAGAPAAAPPLQVAAARAALESARLATRLQRRSLLAAPAITAGFETGDPSGAEPGMLPTVGIALPLPLFDWNRGPIAQARAEQERARAELALAEVTSRVEIARARRELAVALERVARDRRLVAAADRVAAMSLTAYREGASALPNVLEAQRSARDVLARYVDDLAGAWIASAELRVLTLTPSDTTP